ADSPHAQHTVLPSGDHYFAVGSHSTRLNKISDVWKSADFLSIEPDEPDLVVAGAGDQLITRAHETHGGHLLVVAINVLLPVTRCNIPHLHHAVRARGRERAAIEAPCDSEDVMR